MKVIDRIHKIGWFSTGRDEAACQLLKVISNSIKRKKLENLAISFVFSNRTKGERKESDSFLELVEYLKIKSVTLSSRAFNPEMRKKGIQLAKRGDLTVINHWRNIYHHQVAKIIDKFGVDFIVLAGYMLIIGEDLCRSYPIINLHPALPGGPKGTWQEVIWKLIRQKAKESGVMMHLVTPELDAGPVITHCSFPLRGGKFHSLWENMERKLKRKTLKRIEEEEGEEEPLFKKIREEGMKRELPLIIYTLKDISEERIALKEEKVKLKEKTINGVCLNEEIEKEIKNETGQS